MDREEQRRRHRPPASEPRPRPDRRRSDRSGSKGSRPGSQGQDQRRSQSRTRRPGTSESPARRTAPPAAGRRTQESPRRRKQPERRTQNKRTPPAALPRRQLILKLVTMLAVVLALVLGMTIFFRVQNLRVTGNSKYDANRVIASSGLEEGASLLTLNKSKAAGQILNDLPYVSEVQVGIKLPNTVTIDIVELDITYAVEGPDGTWWLMDARGKLLEQVSGEEAGKHTRIVGIQAVSPAVGATLQVTQEDQKDTDEQKSADVANTIGFAQDRMEAAISVLKALEESDRMGKATKVDVSSLYDLQVWYGEKYQVLLSGPTELGYKVRYMVQAVDRLEADGYRGGTLDLSIKEAGKATFTPW